jgi:hypothetical protein
MTLFDTQDGQELKVARRPNGLFVLANQLSNLFEVLHQTGGRDMIANDLHVRCCGECGAVWWDQYDITTLDENGKAIKTHPGGRVPAGTPGWMRPGMSNLNLHIRIGDTLWYALASDIGTDLISIDPNGIRLSTESFASREDLLRKVEELAPIGEWKTKEQREREAMGIYAALVSLSLSD